MIHTWLSPELSCYIIGHCLLLTSGAVQELVKAAEKAQKNKLQLLYTQSRLQISHCQVRSECSYRVETIFPPQLLLGCHDAGLIQAEQCLPALLAHGSLVDASRAWLLAARARFADFGLRVWDLNSICFLSIGSKSFLPGLPRPKAELMMSAEQNYCTEPR